MEYTHEPTGTEPLPLGTGKAGHGHMFTALTVIARHVRVAALATLWQHSRNFLVIFYPVVTLDQVKLRMGCQSQTYQSVVFIYVHVLKFSLMFIHFYFFFF